MKVIATLGFLGLALLSVSCGSSYKIVKSKSEENFHLASYPTYGFYQVDAKGDTIAAKFGQNLEYIKSAISRNLKARGLNEAQDPALRINIGISVEKKAQTRQTDFRTDGRMTYIGQRNYSWHSEDVVVGYYREGTMIIDLVQTSDNKMVYQGGGEGILPEKKDLQKTIDKLVDGFFAKIPN